MVDNIFKAKLIAVTQPVVEGIDDAKELIVYCARVSAPSNQMNMETADKLLNYLVKHRHWSPLEMANCVVEIECPRDIARQILRHRSFSFQEFCIAGDSMVSVVTPAGKISLVSIQDLYKKQFDPRFKSFVRVYDEEKKQLIPTKIKEVFNTGVKPVYRLVLKNGKNIKATLDHKFLTKEGFKELRHITAGDVIGTNGVDAYKDYDWMLAAKEQSIRDGSGVQGIADKAGCSYHTIRKWLRIHGLQFSKQEVATYTPIWNKGLPVEMQPMYGKVVSDETRLLMTESARHGEDSNLWTGGISRGFRQEVADWQLKYKHRLIVEHDNKCLQCGSEDDLEIDHIIAVSQDPSLAFDYDNLQILCHNCHKQKTKEECAIAARWSMVESIEFVGDEQTYDIEVEHDSHNYVANGIITHNSQRYADVTQLDNAFCHRNLRMQDTKNRQNSLETDDNELKDWWLSVQTKLLDDVAQYYTQALNKGIAKEVARVLLPEGLTMSRMYVNGTIRSWVHYLEVRMESGVSQQEHVELANLIAAQINSVFKVTNESP